MHAHSLTHVPDEKLLADLSALVVKDRLTTAALLAHIAEVDARELYKPAAYSSMFAYCTQALHLGDDVAYKRIQVARAARRFPVIFDAIADGRLHVSGAAMLGPHLTESNVARVIAAATHRSKAEIEVIVAGLAPRPDVPTSLVPVASRESGLDLDPVPGPLLDTDPVIPPAPPPRVKPLAPERYELRVTIGQATREKIERAKALMRHQNPSGDLAQVIDRALDAVIEKLEKQQFGATSRPRVTRARAEAADPHYIPNAVRRAVYARDGGQCTFVSADGVRCGERGFLQLDHRIPVARGGQPTIENVRLLCEPHNQYEAELKLGRDFMQSKRAAAKAAKRARPPAHAARLDRRDEVARGQGARDEGGASPTDRDATSRVDEAARNEKARSARGAAELPPAGDATRQIEADVALALRGLGFKADETSRAMVSTAGQPAATFEERVRAALIAATRARGNRCREGSFEMRAWRTDLVEWNQPRPAEATAAAG